MTAVVVALAAAVAVLAILVAGLLRSHAEILRALHELGAGLELDRQGGADGGPRPLVLEPFASVRPTSGAGPGHNGNDDDGHNDGSSDGSHNNDGADLDRPTSVTGSTLDDEVVSLPLRGAGDTLLAFLSSGCSTCQGFWEAFSTGSRNDVPGGARLVVVAQGPADESESALRERAPAAVPLVLSSEAWAQFSVPGSPYFAYVDGDTGRVVGEGSAGSWPQVVDLLGQARADDRSRRNAGSTSHTRTADHARSADHTRNSSDIRSGSSRTGSSRVAGNGAHRRGRDDAALLAAGISADDPSLWPGADQHDGTPTSQPADEHAGRP